MSVRQGLIDLVQARGAGSEFRLGRYFVEHGLVTPEDIDRLLRDNAPTPRPPPPESGSRSAMPRDEPPHRGPQAARRPARRLGPRDARSAPRGPRAPVERAGVRGAPVAARSLRVPPRAAAGARRERAAGAPGRVGRDGGLPPRRRVARRRGGARAASSRCSRPTAVAIDAADVERLPKHEQRLLDDGRRRAHASARSSSRATCRASTRARSSSSCSRRASCGAGRRDAWRPPSSGAGSSLAVAAGCSCGSTACCASCPPRSRCASRRRPASRPCRARRRSSSASPLYEGAIVPVIAIGRRAAR